MTHDREAMLSRTGGDDGEIVLSGRAPGPAGSASIAADAGLVVGYDIADPTIVTSVVAERSLVHERTVRALLGSAAWSLIDGRERPHEVGVAPEDRVGATELAGLAILDVVRHVPVGHRDQRRWAAEALYRADVVRRAGYDVEIGFGHDARLVASSLLGIEATDERLAGVGSLLGDVARIAEEHLDPEDETFGPLAELVERLPPTRERTPQLELAAAAPLVGRTMLVTTAPPPTRWTEAVLWAELPDASLPHAAGFADAVSVDVVDPRHLQVRFRCGQGGPRRLSVRFVDGETGELVSVGSVRRSEDHEYHGRLTIDRDIDRDRHRVEIVERSTMPVRRSADRTGRLARQWGLLALYAERTGARAAASYWDRSATLHEQAGNPGAAAMAVRYREQVETIGDDPTLAGRRALPFLTEADLL